MRANLTPEVLKAIAHPVRLSLYEVLVARGPATAAQLAKFVPGAPGSLSYHLRQLERSGFIEEAPELGADARERWWRAVPGGIDWSEEDLDGSPGTREAAATAESVLLRRQVERMRMWVRESHVRWDARWRAAAVNVDSVLVLDVHELEQLGRELNEVLDSWRTRSRERESAPATQVQGPEGEGDARCATFVSIHAFPFDPTSQQQSR